MKIFIKQKRVLKFQDSFAVRRGFVILFYNIVYYFDNHLYNNII